MPCMLYPNVSVPDEYGVAEDIMQLLQIDQEPLISCLLVSCSTCQPMKLVSFKSLDVVMGGHTNVETMWRKHANLFP
jgi:hypothetical protein